MLVSLDQHWRSGGSGSSGSVSGKLSKAADDFKGVMAEVDYMTQPKLKQIRGGTSTVTQLLFELLYGTGNKQEPNINTVVGRDHDRMQVFHHGPEVLNMYFLQELDSSLALIVPRPMKKATSYASAASAASDRQLQAASELRARLHADKRCRSDCCRSARPIWWSREAGLSGEPACPSRLRI